MPVIHNKIYFNNNRTTAMDPAVEETIKNYSSSRDPQEELHSFRAQIGKLIESAPEEIILTSGTSASIHLGISTCFKQGLKKGRHVIINPTEHFAVLDACELLRREGAEISTVPVDREGRVDAEDVRRAIRPDTQLVCMMAANNETGVIQDLETLGDICKTHAVTLFSDACQVVGKSRMDVQELKVDCMAFGSHKMYGPAGIGALYVREPALRSFISSLHLYSPDPKLAAGFAKASEIFLDHFWDQNAHVSKLKNYFEHQLLDIPGLRINGSTRYRLYNTSNICFPEHLHLKSLLDRFDFAHNFDKTSYVLEAMGLHPTEVKNSFRFSFGKYNTLEEVQLLVQEILKL